MAVIVFVAFAAHVVAWIALPDRKPSQHASSSVILTAAVAA
jgi:hypothetical protein